MSTARDDFQTKEKQNCPICLGDFKTPRQLPCMHSFCEKCLQDYLSSQGKNLRKLKQVKCPICRQAVSISQEGKWGPNVASLFPINVILQSIVRDAKEKVDHSCDSCHSTGISWPAQGVCVQCEEIICEHCSEVHQKQKISRTHVIISMQEFTSNPQLVMTLAKGFSCPDHEWETIDFYCKDHETACCGKCCIVSHINCSHVSDLKKELPSLQQERNPDDIIDQMKILESHMKECKEVNETSTSHLESQVNGLTAQIRELRKNDELDELERIVTIVGNRIYKEEKMKKEEERNRFQSLINSIQNSHMLLETVKKYGTAMQVFITTKMILHTAYVILGSDPRRIHKDRDCYSLVENYTGATYLYSGHVMLADFKNDRLCLLDSSYNLITRYKLHCFPQQICVVNDNDDVDVTQLFKQTVQLVSVKNGKITPTKDIPFRYKFNGVAAVGNGNIIVSGYCDDRRKYFWSLISSGGKEKSCHMFE
ncbi:hypothetical protein CHS0354_032630 [Potamilus streckersoni]|uniref:RING-type domain-containing protein n=1 Tax=Potamilus streckersoni TaxID=2493646 RepID=A0AAE0VVP3_9BIVA|nr:hypothetical protein CHS0354_032630 [Potamilus streckersoni]